MTEPRTEPTSRDLADEWEREKKKLRASPSQLFKSHAAPFFVFWIVFGAMFFCIGLFAFHVELGLAILMGVLGGLFAGLRVVLKIRR